MAKSYFAILGVASGATPDEVRSAYRRLAKEFHPDYYEGDSGPFREVQEAYSVLGNPQRRRDYEQSLAKLSVRRHTRNRVRPEPEPLIPKRGAFDIGEYPRGGPVNAFSSSFDEIFEWLWNNFPGRK